MNLAGVCSHWHILFGAHIQSAMEQLKALKRYYRIILQVNHA
jgi:hypothetical protein